jgi:hypothetical protein
VRVAPTTERSDGSIGRDAMHRNREIAGPVLNAWITGGTPRGTRRIVAKIRPNLRQFSLIESQIEN